MVCTVQRSARMTSVTPHRNRTWGSPEGGMEKSRFSALFQGSEVRSRPHLCILDSFSSHLPWALLPQAVGLHPHHSPLPSVSKPTTTPRAPFTRPWDTAKFFTNITCKGEKAWRAAPFLCLASGPGATAVVLGGWGLSWRGTESYF